MTKVSVILTVYNKPRWLKECIDSVIGQTYQDWELIIMEDNSPDSRVKSILENDYSFHPKIKIHYSNTAEENRFKTARYATLINEGIRNHSSGKYITYLVDDDYYFPWRLETMVKTLESRAIDIVYGSQLFVDAEGRIAGYRKTQGILENAWDKVDHNSVMHTRRVFDQAGGWDDDPGTWGGSDSYFWRRIAWNTPYEFYPLSDNMPNEAKRYHDDSIQWAMSNNNFFPG